MTSQSERRQLPTSPAHSVTTRRHSASQEAHMTTPGDIRRNKEQNLSRPKSADVSSYQEMIIPSDDNTMELPQLHPPPVKKLLLPVDTPPSPAPTARMSPKVAASLEKINQLLASNPPLQQANIVSDRYGLEVHLFPYAACSHKLNND